MTRSRALLSASAVALVFSLLAGSVRADCPVPKGADPKLAAVDDGTRLDFILRSLARDARDTMIWVDVWMGGNAVLLAGTGGLASFYPAANRIDLLVGIGATSIAAAPLVVLPPSVTRDAPAFERKVVANPFDRCALIRDGERILAKDAVEEAAGGRWLPQVINALYNVSVGLILTFVFHRWQTGIGAMFSGTAIGEAVMLSQPKELPLDAKRYLSGDVYGPPAGAFIGIHAASMGPSLQFSF